MTFQSFVTYVKNESITHAEFYAASLGVSTANINEWKRRLTTVS